MKPADLKPTDLKSATTGGDVETASEGNGSTPRRRPSLIPLRHRLAVDMGRYADSLEAQNHALRRTVH